jgi:HD-GYP domain-containing protein (c-di-GMP phosphodiesterase class II)
MRPRLGLAPKTLAVLLAAAFAVTLGIVAYAANAWPRLENDTVDLRFSLRKAPPPSDVVVVGIDDRTFSALKLQWPFPRTLDADVIKRLHADGARTIVYDVQFTEPSTPSQDLALYSEIGRVGGVVLATTEVNAAGESDVLGGEANLRRAHAVAAASNLPADPGGVIRRYQYRQIGLPSLAVAAARADGHPISPARFGSDGAWIDFRGPPGAIPTVSFSDVLRGQIPSRAFAGKVVVVGAAAATLQDLHPTSTTSSNPMSGPEIQANAIWTALHGNPLRPAPGWLGVLSILLAGIVAPLASLRFRASTSALIALAIAAVYLLLAQFAFASGTILLISYPLVAWAVGLVGMVGASYVGALIERDAFSRRLSESQRELIQRLAHAVEFRDAETGEHIQRIGVLCERLALAIGWKPADAEMLRYASAMHDIGKIGVPDRVLLKRGRLNAEEWAIIRTHPVTGGEILAGSDNPLLQIAEQIARTHHERWDGGGYPAGLRGEQIPLAGRICTICDVYDALVSKRSYKESWTVRDTLAEIEHGAGTRFDPELVAAFMRLVPRLADELEDTYTDARADDRRAADRRGPGVLAGNRLQDRGRVL